MLIGLGADVSASGQVNVPFWCSVFPGSSAVFQSCKAPTAEDTAVAAQSLATCQDYAAKNYPTTTTVLGQTNACHLVAGDWNGPIALVLGGLTLFLLVPALMKAY